MLLRLGRAALAAGGEGGEGPPLHGGWTVDALAELDLAYAPPCSPGWDPILVAANLARR